MKRSKIKKYSKNRWNCVLVCVCVCVIVWVIVAYYYVWMCKWCLVYAYMKIHALRDKLEVVYRIGESKLCYSRGKKKFFIYFYMWR